MRESPGVHYVKKQPDSVLQRHAANHPSIFHKCLYLIPNLVVACTLLLEAAVG